MPSYTSPPSSAVAYEIEFAYDVQDLTKTYTDDLDLFQRSLSPVAANILNSRGGRKTFDLPFTDPIRGQPRSAFDRNLRSLRTDIERATERYLSSVVEESLIQRLINVLDSAFQTQRQSAGGGLNFRISVNTDSIKRQLQRVKRRSARLRAGLFATIRKNKTYLRRAQDEYLAITNGSASYFGSIFDGLADAIYVAFYTGAVYKYSRFKAGLSNVENMIQRGEENSGLVGYIWRNVYFLYD